MGGGAELFAQEIIKESREAKLASLGTALGESTFLIMVVLIHQFLGLFDAFVGPFKSVHLPECS